MSKRGLLLAAVGLAFFRARVVQSSSYIASTAGIFVILLLSKWFWQIIVYPHFLSPLRVLPQPKVSLHSSPKIMSRETRQSLVFWRRSCVNLSVTGLEFPLR